MDSLKIIVKGLNATERRLLAGTIRLSERRKPKLELVSDTMITIADVIVVDSKDADSMAWSKTHAAQLNSKTVIWVDMEAQNPRHGSLKRPVLWVNLPIIISRILDEASVLDLKVSGADAAVEEAVPAVDNNRLNILVVDDSPAIRQHMTTILAGKNVVAVESGELAVEMVEQQPFDCVFMDVLMPGMDGYQACKKIKSKKFNGKTLPVIMLTGKSSPFDRIRGKMAGCNAYLTKPVAVDRLKKELSKVTGVTVT